MSFYELAVQWRYGDGVVSGESKIMEVSLMFDHDYMFHVLFTEWDIEVSATPLGFSLWFYGPDEDAIPVRRWDLSNDDDGSVPPYVECSTLVQDWRTLVQQMGVS